MNATFAYHVSLPDQVTHRSPGLLSLLLDEEPRREVERCPRCRRPLERCRCDAEVRRA